jgi:hypothetical protein
VGGLNQTRRGVWAFDPSRPDRVKLAGSIDAAKVGAPDSH